MGRRAVWPKGCIAFQELLRKLSGWLFRLRPMVVSPLCRPNSLQPPRGQLRRGPARLRRIVFALQHAPEIARRSNRWRSRATRVERELRQGWLRSPSSRNPAKPCLRDPPLTGVTPHRRSAPASRPAIGELSRHATPPQKVVEDPIGRRRPGLRLDQPAPPRLGGAWPPLPLAP